MTNYLMYMCVHKMTEAETITAFENAGFRPCMPPADYEFHNAFYWLCKTIHINPNADYFAHIMREHRVFLNTTKIASRRVQFDVRHIKN